MIELVGEERLEDMRDAHCVGYHCGCAYIGSRDIGHCVACKVRRDFLAGARAVSEKLGVEIVLEVDLEKPWLCPLMENSRYDDDEDECECWNAVERHDMPTSCPKVVHKHGEPLKLLTPDKCPLRKGPVLVRAKEKP